MSTPQAVLPPETTIAEHSELDDLDIRIVPTGPLIPEFVRLTTDTCTATSMSACPPSCYPKR